MPEPLITSSSLTALTEKYTQITYNLANASTVGFKRRQADFTLVDDPESQVPDASIVQMVESLDLQQGNMITTGRPLDFAISGPGFFTIETPSGPIYTRNGQFRLNAANQVVDFAGRNVAGTSGTIALPDNMTASDITVTREGNVWAGGRKIAQLRMVQFQRPGDLEPLGDSSFRKPANRSPSQRCPKPSMLRVGRASVWW